MKVICRTNLDLFNEVFPNDLPAVPRVGDLIESQTDHGGFRLRLAVTRVTWSVRLSEWRSLEGYVPQIELHDWLGRSVKEFYEWYAPLVGKEVSSFI